MDNSGDGALPEGRDWRDAALRGVQAEIDACLDDLAKLQAHLAALKEFQRSLMRVVEAPKPVASVSSDHRRADPATGVTASQARPATTSALIREGARKVLRETGRPMNRAELLEALRGRGVEVKATDPARAVGRVLWRSEEFVHLDDGYWLAAVPVPDGGVDA
ncbi:hypothetical protein [Aureimonas sp. Leaf324]|uniref:hypothetical protein n=1 Tax=Aureimonas sp. Leaf324 TaxID=1736336 RepID=UPI000B1EF5D8|nr:hypothetical protein [Aureimonas sp. Leaf324]